MDFAAPHMGFVVAAYAVSAIGLVGLALAVALRLRRTTKLLRSLEAQGAQRRPPGEARAA